MESKDSHLNILMKIQGDLGDVKTETKVQSQILKSMDERIAVANSKTAKNVLDIQSIKDERNIEKGKNIVVMLIIGFVMSIVGGLIVAFTRTKIGI